MHPGQAKCGAKTRRGTECKDIAMANGRCKRHGGKSTGAKKPHSAAAEANPAYTHGIYSKYYRDEEKALIDAGAIALGQVDDELRVVRVRLKRALEAKERWEAEVRGEVEGSTEASSLVLVETEEGEKPFGKDADVMPYEASKRRLPDFEGIIDRCLSRIESLEKTRKELLKDSSDDGDADRDPGDNRDRVRFSGGLDGGNDEDLPSPFAPKP